jgi:hypothetical protein
MAAPERDERQTDSWRDGCIDALTAEVKRLREEAKRLREEVERAAGLRKALTDIAQCAPKGSWAQMTAAIALRTLEEPMAEPQITDDMTSGATGFDPMWLVGRKIEAVHEITDSDRVECLLVLDDGRVVLVSCDPTVHDERGVPLPPEESGKTWEVVMYDATETEAGRVALASRTESKP